MKIKKADNNWKPVTIQIEIESYADALAIFNLYNSERQIMNVITEDLEYLNFSHLEGIEHELKRSLSKILSGMYVGISNI